MKIKEIRRCKKCMRRLSKKNKTEFCYYHTKANEKKKLQRQN